MERIVTLTCKVDGCMRMRRYEFFAILAGILCVSVCCTCLFKGGRRMSTRGLSSRTNVSIHQIKGNRAKTAVLPHLNYHESAIRCRIPLVGFEAAVGSGGDDRNSEAIAAVSGILNRGWGRGKPLSAHNFCGCPGDP